MRGAYTLFMVTLLLASCRHDVFCVDCLTSEGDDGDHGSGPARDAGGFDNVDSGHAHVDGGLADGATGDGDGDGDGDTPTPCTPRLDGELCNGIDDDCDGDVDEDFDLDADPQHCGGCNRPCQVENAEATCVMGSCQVDACLDGFADLDDDADCEYRCPVFPPRAEDCDGVDDDCDGQVDETLGAPPDDVCRTTAGTPCEDTVARCKTVEGVTTWYCEYPAEVEFDPVVPNGIALEETRCDGHDGDCDGSSDEPWPVGDTCDDGNVGVCRDVGALACDPEDDTAVFCDLSVLPDAQPQSTELCNNLDDDCDGEVDNDVVDDMVHITTGGDFYIFRYEASHPDATSDSQGLADHRACSRADVLPWTYVTFAQAQAACVAAGKRLCTAGEWQAACGSASYPYGDAYAGSTCNGADHGADALLPTGSLSMCKSSAEVFDLSGNAKEWTDDAPPGTSDIYVVRGGSFGSPQLGLTCGTTLSQAAANAGQAAVGFRCCADP